jgi:hypothetical protein
MGTGVFGGMLASTFIATIFVPMFFSWLSIGIKKRGSDLEDEATVIHPNTKPVQNDGEKS